MRPRLALLALLAVIPGVAACGGDDEISDAVPRTTPELTIPTATTEAPAPDDGGGSTTTSTTSTSTTPATGAGGAAPAAPAQPAPAQPAPATGGQAPTDQGQGDDTGGAAAGGGEFEDFCAQNPGAC